MSNPAINVTQLALPKGGGSLRGIGERFQPHEFSGAAALSIPVHTSPCRGFEPKLSVDYSSAAGNGIFGLGWALSIPNIARKTTRGIPKYDGTDTFLLSNAEDLVPIDRRTDGDYDVVSYRPRTEGLFARIERWIERESSASYWRVNSKGNVTSIYGRDPQARICDPDNESHIFQWLLQETYDAKGNHIVYQYKAEDNEKIKKSASERSRKHTANRHLERIKYGNDRALTVKEQAHENRTKALEQLTWHFEVVFDYGERQSDALPTYGSHAEATWTGRDDAFSSYKSGFEIRTHRLCHRILMFHCFQHMNNGLPFLVSQTQFAYGQQPAMTFLKSVTQVGVHDGVTKAMPPLKFGYTEVTPSNLVFKPLQIQAGDDASNIPQIPGQLKDGNYQLVALYGEGLPGILYTDDQTTRYLRPQGEGHYTPSRAPDPFPIERNLQNGTHTLTDLQGDGKLDLVVETPTRSGYYASHFDGRWESFRHFETTPTDLLHPQRQQVDVSGDGMADLLLVEADGVKVYPSKGQAGYGQPKRQATNNGLPVTGHPSAREAVRFVDMFGDGGSHLVRIRNDSVECWPSLGHGRFGAKVEFANPPRFHDEMDAKRLFLTDIDGSGTTDLVYAHPPEGGAPARIDLYCNLSGNGFAEAKSITLPCPYTDLSQISFADVLGNGTACLVFSSINADLSLDHAYMDFTGGAKPHLLKTVNNNMGATTRIHYSPSTKFYLADERVGGTPWITRLPFPVQVVEKIETIDHIGGTQLVASYSYHHGYFDPVDREFRGFGRVERRDTETFDLSRPAADEAVDVNASDDRGLHVPPILTKTWYHTGAYAEAGSLAQQYATEYYHGDGQAYALPDTVLDLKFHDEHPEKNREACRALHGHVLREEVYGLDHRQSPALVNPNLDEHPYTVTASNFYVRCLHAETGQTHAVCHVQSRETIAYHYERNPADPRISHTLTLDVDDFGNVLREATIAYGRREMILTMNEHRELAQVANPAQQEVEADDWQQQTRTLVTYSENRFTNPIDDAGAYHTPLAAETETFEVTGVRPENNGERFTFDEWTRDDFASLTSLTEIPYEQTADDGTVDNGTVQKRLIERVRTYYRPDDLGTAQNEPMALLSLRALEPLALPGESYHLAFTPGLLDQVYVREEQKLLPADPADLLDGGGANGGGYVDLDGDGHWWIPSGRVFMSPGGKDDAATELAYAQSHFFLPLRSRDPFHTDKISTEHTLTYDAHDLLVKQSHDPLDNVVTVENDYHVLQPALLTDPNGNRTAVAFDALGMVVATAVMGKDGDDVGDRLEDFDTDLSFADLHAFVADPHGTAATLLGKATTRIVTDLDRYQRAAQPPFAATLARETHRHDPGGDKTRIQIGFAYSDGFGRAIQTKVQAEPGLAPERQADVKLKLDDKLEAYDIRPGDLVFDADGELAHSETAHRWVGSGRTVFNNKGKPVRQYEPFFSVTHLYEEEREMTDSGVSSMLFYDPVVRVVATLHPNHTYEKVVFDPWRQEHWDVNDTLVPHKAGDAPFDPKNDPHVGHYFACLPDDDYLPTWFDLRTDAEKAAHAWPDLDANNRPHPNRTQRRRAEKAAAVKAAVHATTPTVIYLDTLGRPFLTVKQNKVACPGHAFDGREEQHSERLWLDIEGSRRR